MKRFTLAAVAAGVLGFAGLAFYSHAAGEAQNITPSITTSRFLMFGAPYSIKNELKGEAASSENGVFKIDTYTGKVWALRSMKTEDGQTLQKWRLIEEGN